MANKPTFDTNISKSNDEYFSLQELIDMKSHKLKSMYFEIGGNKD